MFKLRRLHYQTHPYQEALHILLYNNPNGLSAQEIVEKLGISTSECNSLLEIEQIRDTIDADPLTGTLIFKTKASTIPSKSLDDALKNAYKRKMLSITKLGLTLFSTSLISCTILTISVNVFISFDKQNYDVNQYKSTPWHNNQSKETLNKARIEAELAKQKKIEKSNEINDLNQRILNIKSIAKNSKCSIYWDKSQTCYIEGRLLTQTEFEREIDEMKMQISELRRNNN
ncbi:hypothetical protein NUACC21_52730 [Scytonema sp. NUACC21]